ncbi:MAG: hypothetical protein J6K29_10615 [Clostridia bacterium]|nr:hypothetical protein [Clostridia bacterium]
MMHLFKRITAAALAGLMLAGTAAITPVTLSAEAATPTYGGTAITEHKGGYDYYDRKLTTYAYDFSMDRINYYAADPAIALGRTAGEIVDGALTTKEGKDCIFGSAIGLGDDYGLEEGYLSFDLKLTGGEVYLGVRTSRTASGKEDRGIWFTFDGSNSMRIYEPECGLEATVPMPISPADAKSFTLHEGLDTLTLSSGDTVIASVKYTDRGYLAICDGAGAVKAETSESEIYPSGYFSLHLMDIDGYVDNVVFTNVQEIRNIPETDELRVIDYSTWTATDAIDRTVADNAKAGDPKENRYVGLFYFLCWVGAGQVVQDNTKLYLELGAKGTVEYIEKHGGEAYWAEPYFGYYRNTDTWVYRKHAYMLEQAGVDFIFLDVSNAEVFITGHTALFDTWLEMRKQGIDTPQIVFFNGDTPATFQSNMKNLFNTVYSDENWDTYKELFFEWEGKPLVFGNYSGLSGDIKKKVDEKFTVRGSWAWTDKDNYWAWLQEYIYKPDSSVRKVELLNGGWGRDAKGNYEALGVAMGHHPTTSKGRSFVNNREPNNGKGDMEFSSVERAGQGLCFASQFGAVNHLVNTEIAADQPFVMMITGWNEWIAGCFHSESNQSMANSSATFQYVDQFNCEFSRDGEPMRNRDGYGIGDNYYYQMVDYIRQYKGIAAAPAADDQTSINIYDLSSWDGIDMTYMDSLYDVEHRNTISYDPRYRYINNTGRNDFDYAKVSQDEDNLYFFVKTSHDIVIDNDTEWMNLFINVDGDNATGWEGYDFILNRDRDSFVVTVEKFKDNTFESEVVGGAYYYVEGACMTLRLSKELLGISGKLDKMIFKWADNSVDNGDPMAFMDLGDTAPDNRFGFTYICEDYTTKPVAKTVLTADAGKTSANGSIVQKPDSDLNITIKDTLVDVLYDFDEVKAGLFIKDTPVAEQFELAAGTSSSTGQVYKGDNGNYVRLTGYTDLRTWNDVEGSYEFSADIHMVDYGNSAVYLRGEMPGAYTPENPKNFNVKQTFNYFEWDWYAENGGRTFGGSSTAGSGIGLYPDSNAITVRIKRYAPDGLGVASASYKFPYSADFRPDESGWFKLRAVDDGETVSIYFNDILMCSVKLENPGVVYETDGTGQEYYGKAILCDASGKEVLTVENTRLNSAGSQIAFTTRSQTMEFANLYIAYKSQVAEGSRVETVLNGDAGEVDYTPDQRLVTTLDLGKEPAYTEDDTTDNGGVTSPVGTTPEGVDPAESESQSGQGKGCKSILALPALLSILGAGLWLMRRRNG